METKRAARLKTGQEEVRGVGCLILPNSDNEDNLNVNSGNFEIRKRERVGQLTNRAEGERHTERRQKPLPVNESDKA